ncbi:hypothetical protein HGA88_05085 [Candidatus Roizmanbacteria bacterium]|nr:hypothetical protein [Candidatus Roizmanbacteria bacterium]
MALLILLITPLSSIIFYLLSKKRFLYEIIAAVSAGVEFVTGMFMVSQVVVSGHYAVGPYFSLNAFGALLLAICIFIGLITTFHSIGYLRAEQQKGMLGLKRIQVYYVLKSLFMLSMFGALTTTNPIVMWISIESTTLSSVFLVALFNRNTDIEAAWKYLIINSVGLLLCLLGTLLFLGQASGNGFATWNDLMAKAAHFNPIVSKVAFVFVLIGFGTKMGLVPMHTWKPDAYNKAPLPIVALLSGALLNVAFFALLRFKLIVDAAIGPAFSQILFISFGIISIALPAFIIFTQLNYKRMLAYSSIEHAGIMLLGFGFGGIGIYGSILHILYHSFAKSLLFLVSSNIAVRYSSSKVKDVTGMIKILPYSSVLLIIGFLTITGIPPFGIFFSELYIFIAGFHYSIVLTSVTIVLLLLVFIGLFKQYTAMLFGEPPAGMHKEKYNFWTIIPLVFLAVVLVITSIYLPEPLQVLLKESNKLFAGTL